MVPRSARAKKAIGRAQIGRISDRRNARISMVGISAMIQSTPAIETPDVDQGNKIAMSTVSRSIFKIRAAGSRQAERTSESPETPGSLLTASVIPGPFSRLKTDHKYLAQAAKAPQSRKLVRERARVSCHSGARGARRGMTFHPHSPAT